MSDVDASGIDSTCVEVIEGLTGSLLDQSAEIQALRQHLMQQAAILEAERCKKPGALERH